MTGRALANRPAGPLRILWWVAVLVLMARLGFVLLHQPLAGFANQFDMIRTTDCLGLRPDAAVAHGVATMDAPVSRYIEQPEPVESGCLPTTEVAISALAIGIDELGDSLGVGDPQSLPLRLIACIKALMLLFALAWVDRRLRAYARVRVVHAWIGALFLVDPFNSLFLAGFYTEFSALLSAYLALALPLIWLVRARAPAAIEILSWASVLGAFAMSRFQHAMLPCLMLLWLLWLAWRRGWPLGRLILWPSIVLAAALCFQLQLQSTRTAIADANRWDSFFGAALPAAHDPLHFVRQLGLPDQCAELTHTTWYLRRGRDARVECPQAFQLSRVRWLSHLAMQPRGSLEFLGRGVMLSGQWRPTYLGELAGRSTARMAPGHSGLGASLSGGIAALPFVALCVFWTLPLILLAQIAISRRNSPSPSPDQPDEPDLQGALVWIVPMLAMMVVLGWAASLVGDGYSEVARHLHLAANATFIASFLLVIRLVHALAQRGVGRRPKIIAIGSIAFVLVLSIGIHVLTHHYFSLGYGVLDTPADERIDATTGLSGWAMDPRGIQSVDVVNAKGERRSLTIEPHPALSGFFGRGNASTAVSFSGQLRFESPADNVIRIEVLPRAGEPTTIDRRWFRYSVHK